jgi:hypothetical protein
MSTSAANDSMGLHTQPYVITQIMYAETGRYFSVGMLTFRYRYPHFFSYKAGRDADQGWSSSLQHTYPHFFSYKAGRDADQGRSSSLQLLCGHKSETAL